MHFLSNHFLPSVVLVLSAALLGIPGSARAEGAGTPMNRFGLELHRRLTAKEQGNQVSSPWSIQMALAMTYAGAAGKTKQEMGEVLHYGSDDTAVHASFATLSSQLEQMKEQSTLRVKQAKQSGGPSSPLEINIANRLFGEDSYPFERPFLKLLESCYDAPLQAMDFQGKPEPSRREINQWVERQTRKHIQELLPAGTIDKDSRLVLVNAVHLKAPWSSEFDPEPGMPFFVKGGNSAKVAGMTRQGQFGYLKIPEGIAVTIPYADPGLQFVIFLPDGRQGLAAVEKALTPEILAKTAGAQAKEIKLHLPSFKLQPSRVFLEKELMAMGMPSAFNQPPGSADFSAMAPRKPDDYLFISNVVHQAFLSVDEHGTEAAAATAVLMSRVTAAPPEPGQPLEIRVDRPFAFAVQHQPSGACLFLGRVVDPR